MSVSYDLQVMTRAFMKGDMTKFRTYKLYNRACACFPPGVLFTVCRENLILISVCPGETFEESKECVEIICRRLGIATPDHEEMERLYCKACERGYQLYDSCRGEWFCTPTTHKIKFVFQPNINTRELNK